MNRQYAYRAASKEAPPEVRFLLRSNKKYYARIPSFNAAACLLALLVGWCAPALGAAAPAKNPVRKKIVVVSSYHPEYEWSRDTSRGFCDAMLKFGYFETPGQAEEFCVNDYVTTSKVVVRKFWLDATRITNKPQLTRIAVEMTRIIKGWSPDLIFLGDDEAGNYIGNQFLDTATPLVFWGFNANPVKYGLMDTADRPGHNITGVYESGYYLDSIRLLRTLAPRVKTFAILTDDSPSARAHQKGIEFLARKGLLPVKLVATVSTNDYALWKAKALELQKRTDSFFVAEYSSLKDEKGNPVPNEEAARWYLEHITVPEATLGFMVRQGLLCGADDSGYKQSYEAVSIAHDILANGASPSIYPARTPQRGALRVNRERAALLGIVLPKDKTIEEYIDRAQALKELKK